MEDILFLQSEKKDPFGFYKQMLNQNPIYYDQKNRIWGVYSAKACREILNNSAAVIPPVTIHPDASQRIRFILHHLPRLTNKPGHEFLRSVSSRLMQSLMPSEIPSLFHLVIGEPKTPASLEWVTDVATKLPITALLRGFGFPITQIEGIASEMLNVVKIMTPAVSREEIEKINISVEEVFRICSLQITSHLQIKNDAEVYTANLIGLLIQSYDATRGLLSNSLLRAMNEANPYRNDLSYYQQVVHDTLRFDPPVHNTRRVLIDNIHIQQHSLNKGDQILVVIASGGLQDDELLSFGDGVHSCIAKYFTIDLTAQVLHYFFNKYVQITLSNEEILYEPRVNVRMPVCIDLTIK